MQKTELSPTTIDKIKSKNLKPLARDIILATAITLAGGAYVNNHINKVGSSPVDIASETNTAHREELQTNPEMAPQIIGKGPFAVSIESNGIVDIFRNNAPEDIKIPDWQLTSKISVTPHWVSGQEEPVEYAIAENNSLLYQNFMLATPAPEKNLLQINLTENGLQTHFTTSDSQPPQNIEYEVTVPESSPKSVETITVGSHLFKPADYGGNNGEMNRQILQAIHSDSITEIKLSSGDSTQTIESDILKAPGSETTVTPNGNGIRIVQDGINAVGDNTTLSINFSETSGD
jgi:hypothetical protein